LTFEVNLVVLVVVLRKETDTPFLKLIIRENSRAMFVAVRRPVLAIINYV